MDFIFLLVLFGFVALMLFDMAENAIDPKAKEKDPLFQFYNWIKGSKQNHRK